MEFCISVLFWRILEAFQTLPVLFYDRPASTGNCKPERWTKAQVVKWIDGICDEYEIEKEEVIDLKKSNGKGLDLLKKEDWLRRSPVHGDMLYELWKQLKTQRSHDSPKQQGID